MPFGFTSGGDGSDEPEGSGDADAGGANPFGFLGGLGGLSGAGGLGDAASMGQALQKLGELMQWQGGPVNWDMARDVARQALVGGDKSVPLGARGEIEDALRLADLWLDDATALPATAARAEAWSRAEWVERTLPQWALMIDPIALRVVDAMSDTLGGQAAAGLAGLSGLPGMPDAAMLEAFGAEGGLPAEALAPITAMMRSLGGALFATQIGQALGALAGEVVGSTDVGMPLAPEGRSALLPAGVAAFGQGLEVPEGEVRLYLALREAAHQRLFSSAGWLRSRLQAEIDAYASGISLDTSAIEAAVSQLDPSDPTAMQEAMSSGLFDQDPSPAQQAVLLRLETLLALVEGWVDDVVDAAAEPRLAHSGALREAVRRRRATGGPAERLFAELVGLTLRPRRLRDAAALWRQVAAARGIEGRDAVWDHPDLLPGTADLDDPRAFVAAGTNATGTAGSGDDDTDRELRALLDGEAGPGPAGTPGDDPPGPS